MRDFFVLAVTAAVGLLFFPLRQPYPAFGLLGVLLLATRFRRPTADLGKFVEILLAFCLIWYGIESFWVTYPGSLIIIVTVMVGLIFYEGPEWGELFFGAGQMRAQVKTAVVLAAGGLIVLGGAAYAVRGRLENPVPAGAPLDVLFVLGLGLALYLPLMEESIFRSFVYQRATATSRPATGILAQALLYGFMSYAVAVPSGLLGGVLGFLLALALGFLVYKSQSIYPAVLCRAMITLGLFMELAILGR